MKNLKKALALLIASVTVFGTVASATPDMTVFKAVSGNWTMQQVVENNASFSSTSTVVDGTHTKSYDAETGAAKLVSSGGGAGLSLMHAHGIYGNTNSHYGVFGNLEQTIEFEINGLVLNETKAADLTANNWCSLDKGNPLTLVMGVSYIPKDRDTLVSDWNTTGISPTGKFLANPDYANSLDIVTHQEKLVLCGKESEAFPLLRNRKYELKINVNTVDDYATVVLRNVTDGTEVKRLEVTPEDGIDIIYANHGFASIITDAFNFSLYKTDYKYQSYFAHTPTFNVSDEEVSGTVLVSTNEYSAADRNTQVVLVQYDENGRFLKAKTSSYTKAPTVPVLKTDYANLGGNEATVTDTKAAGYSYAKMFVWDTMNTMNPVSKVLTSN